MSAHPQQNGSVLAVAFGNLSSDDFEILRGKNVRQAAYESAEARALLKAFAEQRSLNFTESFCDRISADFGEIERFKLLVRHAANQRS
jgi:hypothetical protein